MIPITKSYIQSKRHTKEIIYSSTINELRTVYPHELNECAQKVVLISEGSLLIGW